MKPLYINNTRYLIDVPLFNAKNQEIILPKLSGISIIFAKSKYNVKYLYAKICGKTYSNNSSPELLALARNHIKIYSNISIDFHNSFHILIIDELWYSKQTGMPATTFKLSEYDQIESFKNHLKGINLVYRKTISDALEEFSKSIVKDVPPVPYIPKSKLTSQELETLLNIYLNRQKNYIDTAFDGSKSEDKIQEFLFTRMTEQCQIGHFTEFLLNKSNEINPDIDTVKTGSEKLGESITFQCKKRSIKDELGNVKKSKCNNDLWVEKFEKSKELFMNQEHNQGRYKFN